MKLSDLLKNLQNYKIKGKREITISGISEDSRSIKKDFLFVAIKGLTVDGHKYIRQAIGNGASAIIGEKDKKELDIPENITYVQVVNPRKTLGLIASAYYRFPSTKLKVIGVTGTKGKTTTSHLIYHVLSKLGKKTGLISSIKAQIGKKEFDTGFHVTNPDPVSLNKFLLDMVKAKCEYAVIEVSSHGIDQHRIAGIEFEVGVLTNIAPEHLDYHKTFENYKKVKMSFINSTKKKVIAPEKTSISILPGEFNNLNAEAAIRTAELLGFDRVKALETLKTFALPEGRMKTIKNSKGLNIIIDFAHNPSSLEALLNYLKSQKTDEQRLIAIFGCASERDDSKRPVMGEISTRLADVSIFTAEDPRREDINKIINEMAEGVENAVEFTSEGEVKDLKNSKKHKFIRIPERGDAISFAIQKVAEKGDIIAICGKGHEKSMAYNGVEYPWSDEKAVEFALKGKTFVIKRPQ